MKNFLKKIKEKNWHLKLLAFGLALAVWFFAFQGKQ